MQYNSYQMILDELIHHVPKIWYRIHWAILTMVNFSLLAGYTYAKVIAGTEFATKYGLNDALLYLTVFNLFYLLIIYWFVARINLVIATFIGSLLIVLPMLDVLSQANQSDSSWIYILIWLGIGWLEGIYGITILIGTLLVTFIYLALEIDFNPGNLQPISYFLAGGAVITVIFGYFFWRGKFLTESSERVDKLSGMLRTNKQQSEILIQSITDGIIVIDTNCKITLINESATKLTSWPENEATGFDARTVLRLLKDPKTSEMLPDTEHPFSKVLVTHKPFSDIMQLHTRDKKNKFISLVVSPVILPKSTDLVGAVAVFRDVSREKEQEKQRADFISTASHEMRTPVAAIEGYLALALNDKVSKIDANAREYLNKAHMSTQHLGKLFQDLLTSAKAEDGRLISRPVVVEMGEFITQLAEDLRFGAEKKGLGMELVVNSKVDDKGVIDTSQKLKTIQPLYYSYIDPDRVREVITNVFDNAVKYTPEGRVSIGLTGNQQVVQIRISDTGPGIPEEDLPHLFQKFYRVDNSATRSIGGTGLGLFICKKIIELYSGNIWAESKLGEGSTFYINLPRLTTARAEQLKSQANTEVAKA